MKGRLVSEVDLLADLNASREDNLFHLRVILSKCFESHRGQREVLSEVASDNRLIAAEFTKLQAERNIVEARLVLRYQNVDIDANNKNTLFSLLSRTQKMIKNYYNKLLVVFPKLADFLNPDTCEFQNELRQEVLEKMSGEKKVGKFFQQFQKCFAGRLKKELGRFVGFYSFYGSLIDKRSQKDEQQFIKIDKYHELVQKQSVFLSVKYHLSNMSKNRTKQTASNVDLYGLSDIQQSNSNNCSSSSSHFTQGKDQGFCELFSLKMDRTLKQLMVRNEVAEKTIYKFILESKVRESQTMRAGKSKQKKPSSNQKKFRSSNKSVNIRSVSETNQGTGQVLVQLPLSQQKPVVRQTLVEMNINDKGPLPNLTHFRLTQFPATSFSFYKDKLNKTQLLMLFRKRFPVILKENV